MILTFDLPKIKAKGLLKRADLDLDPDLAAGAGPTLPGSYRLWLLSEASTFALSFDLLTGMTFDHQSFPLNLACVRVNFLRGRFLAAPWFWSEGPDLQQPDQEAGPGSRS